MKLLKLLCLVFCATLAFATVCSAEEDELLQQQVYDLDGEPAPPPKIRKKTPPLKQAPRPEADKFITAPPPPPPQPRYEAPPVPPEPQPTPPPPPVMGDDNHFIQGDDYFIQRHGLENHTWIWVELAKMVQSPGPATKGDAEFMKVKDGKNYWTRHYWRTRIASQNELRLGLQVIAFNDNHSSTYDAPIKKDRARGGNWFMARITDMSDMYKGYVTVSGNYKVNLGNLRVIVQ